MLQRVLQAILRRYFGEFITGLQHVSLAFWSGHIHIERASFKHNSINDLLRAHGVPLTIKYSFIGSLDVDVPWNKLTTAPVCIKICDALVVFKLEANLKGKEEDNAKLVLIKNYVKHLLKKSAEVESDSEDGGFLKNLLMKILQNMNVEVEHIHIRIQHEQSTGPARRPTRDRAESETQIKLCSFGFCVERFLADSGQQQESKEERIRKNVRLKEISMYWEEADALDLWRIEEEEKNQLLRRVIYRKTQRLLTIDGNVLLERKEGKFDYFFSSHLNTLHVELNYEQLRQIVRLQQEFQKVKTTKKLSKMKQLPYEEQLKLQTSFKALLEEMRKSDFERVETQWLRVIQCVDKRLLLRWSRERMVQMLKEIKIKKALKSKGSGWFSFLSRSSNLELSREQEKEIEAEVSKLVKIMEESAANVGLYLLFDEILLDINSGGKQRILLNINKLEVEWGQLKGRTDLLVGMRDMLVTYEANEHLTSLFIREGSKQGNIFRFQMESAEENRYTVVVESFLLTHEVRVLLFIRELMKLRAKQQVNSHLLLMDARMAQKTTPATIQIPSHFDISVKEIRVVVEVEQDLQIQVRLRSLTVKEHGAGHEAVLEGFRVVYDRTSPILEEMSVRVLQEGCSFTSQIEKVGIVLNEQELRKIYSCMLGQYHIVQERKAEREQEEECYMQGYVKIINAFKTWKTYWGQLMPDRIDLYECVAKSRERPSNSAVGVERNSVMGSFLGSAMGSVLVEEQTPTRSVSLVNASVKSVPGGFHLEGLGFEEVLQSKESSVWIFQIQERIFQNSSKARIYDLIDGGEALPIQSRRISLGVGELSVLYQTNKVAKLLELHLKQLGVIWDKDPFRSKKTVKIGQVQLLDLTVPMDVKQKNALKTQKILDTSLLLSLEDNIIQVISKREDVAIEVGIRQLHMNYNPQIIYALLKKLEDKKVLSYPQEVRNVKVMEMVKQLLSIHRIAPHLAHPPRTYLDLQSYRRVETCEILLHLECHCDSMSLNLVNGRTHHWGHRVGIESLCFIMDKNTECLFVKVKCRQLQLSDITNYPNTIATPYTMGKPTRLICSQKERTHESMVEVFVSSLPQLHSKQRLNTFFSLDLFDLVIHYHHQPIMRFIDYLNNQIISFILAPHSLHLYDSPQRAEFTFLQEGYPTAMTDHQIYSLLQNIIQPSFTHLEIRAHMVNILIASHPNMKESVPVQIEQVTVSSTYYQDNTRLEEKKDVKERLMRQFPSMVELANHEHYGLLMKQWVNRIDITADLCRVYAGRDADEPLGHPFTYSMSIERALHSDKRIVLEWLKLDTGLQLHANIPHLGLLLHRPTYTLIILCVMHNLAYDDLSDRHFLTHYMFPTPSSPLIYSLKIEELSLALPQFIVVEQCVINYKRFKQTELQFTAQSVNLFREEDGREHLSNKLVAPLSKGVDKTVEFCMLLEEGKKTMSAFIRHLDIVYQPTAFTQLLGYFVIEAVCFPPSTSLQDLPLLQCNLYLLDTYITVANIADHVYSLQGDIKFTWTRPIQPHPDLLLSNYVTQVVRIGVNEVNLRKYPIENYLKKRGNYRSLSNAIVMQMQIESRTKVFNKVRYSDSKAEYIIDSLLLKISYKDILQLLAAFVQPSTALNVKHTEGELEKSILSYRDLRSEEPKEPKEMSVELGSIELSLLASENRSKRRGEESQLGSPLRIPKPTKFAAGSSGYTPQSIHHIDIKRCCFQLGLSQLPVPLVDMTVEHSCANIELQGDRTVITSKVKGAVTYWNMMIGRWEPVVQKMKMELTFRVSRIERYAMVESSDIIRVNFSLESLKVLKLISRDIAERGLLPLVNAEEKAKGVQVSPYVLTNRTGWSLYVTSNATVDVKLRDNEKAHLQSRSLDIVENGLDGGIEFQIQGEPQIHKLDLNIASPMIVKARYREEVFDLWITPISSAILKEIVINSSHIVHNRTTHALMFNYGNGQLRVEAGSKKAIPFNEVGLRLFQLSFPHLKSVTENYSFEWHDIIKDYEHYVVYQEANVFNCVVKVLKEREAVITILSVYYFKNLLPLDIILEFAILREGRKVLIHEVLQAGEEKDFYQLGSKDEFSLRVKIKGFNFSFFVGMNEPYPESITFIDHRGLSNSIKTKIIHEGRVRRVFLYAEAVLINETPYKFVVFSEGILLSGQRIAEVAESESKYIFLSPQRLFTLSLREDEPGNSTVFIGSELGNQRVSLWDRQILYELVINNALSCLDEPAGVYTNVLKVSPKFIIVNRTTRQLGVRQEMAEEVLYLRVGEMKDWVWQSKEQPHHISVTLVDNDVEMTKWGYSVGLDIQTIQETVLVLQSANEKILLKIELFKEYQQTYLVLREINGRDSCFFTLKNQLKLVNIKMHQRGKHQSTLFQCPSMQQIQFGWNRPAAPHILVMSLLFVGPLRSKFKNSELIVDVEGPPLVHVVQNEEGESLEIDVEVETLGLTRIVRLSMRTGEREQDIIEQSGNKLGISFSEIGISLIGGSGKRMEVVYVSLQKFEAILMEKQEVRSLTVRVKFLQIDNNCNHNSIYPVLFTPLKEEKTRRKPRFFFVILIQQDLRQTQLKQIKALRVCMEPVSLKIHDEVLVEVYKLMQEAQRLKDKEEIIDVGKIFNSYAARYEWELNPLIKESNEIFFQEVEIAKLQLQISFSLRPKNTGGNFIIFTIVSSFGAAITNVTESQLILSRFARKEITLGQLVNQLNDFYTKSFIKGIYKLLGSLNVLGSPYVFIKLLAQGTWEIVNQPTEGFIKGPLQGVVGIVKGGVYFGRNVVVGTFNSLEAFSQSCSKGVGYLTMDERYIEKREKIKIEKSRNVLLGMKFAAVSVYTGMEQAITGLVTHPKKDYEAYGWYGVITGSLKGVSGIFTKPISGLFEGISKLSQGIKNTALAYQDGPQSKRMRSPRVFLSTLQYYTDYDRLESYTISVLEYASTKYLNEEIMFIHVEGGDRPPTAAAYVLTKHYFLRVSLHQKKVVEEVELDEIDTVQINEDQVILDLKRRKILVDIPRGKQLYGTFKELYDF